jgi:hypothetical protein
MKETACRSSTFVSPDSYMVLRRAVEDLDEQAHGKQVERNLIHGVITGSRRTHRWPHGLRPPAEVMVQAN